MSSWEPYDKYLYGGVPYFRSSERELPTGYAESLRMGPQAYSESYVCGPVSHAACPCGERGASGVCTVYLRPVGLEDAQFLYRLLETRPPEANISHRRMPSYDQHLQFVTSKPYLAWYVVLARKHDDGLDDVGSIYLTREHEIGLSLLSKWRSQGVGRRATRELMRLHPLARYLANVAPGNEAGARFWERQGFRLIQRTYELDGRREPRESERRGG